MDVPLTRGLFAKVDDADWPEVGRHKWYASKVGETYYAVRRESRRAGHKVIYLHRQLLGAGPKEIVDHANGDTLDCRRSNLRACTKAANTWNGTKRKRSTASSRFKGVYLHRATGMYMAMVQKGGRCVFSKYEKDEAKAARAYDAAAVQHFGEFACVNFPEDFPHLNLRGTNPLPVAG